MFSLMLSQYWATLMNWTMKQLLHLQIKLWKFMGKLQVTLDQKEVMMLTEQNITQCPDFDDSKSLLFYTAVLPHSTEKYSMIWDI